MRTSKLFLTLTGVLFSAVTLLGQINPKNVTIIRDNFGIPHIYGKSDADMTYGLIWAACEDDFTSIQEGILASKGLLSRVKGKDGAIRDVLAHVLQAQDKSEELLASTTLTPEFAKLIQAYEQAINTYAAKYPKQVLLKNVFPVSKADIVASQIVGVSLISNVHIDIVHAITNTLQFHEIPQSAGSNAFAINGNKSADESTMLCLNSHQPLEGPYAWYEAHINSEESGINMYGATFAGGMSLFIGANQNLGWSHTVNFPDHTDTYKLKMHPKEKLQYELDGKWETLEEYPIKMKVKVGFIKLPIKKKFYKSKHGTVIKNKSGYYAIRNRANMDIRASEQWFMMCKAKNMEEFKAAIDLQYIPALNTIYADKEGNIFQISSGSFPYRDKRFDWKKVLPGNNSALIWDEKEKHPTSDLPQITNPYSGYIYNTNNPPFNCTSEEYSLDPQDYDPTFGFQTKENNRGIRTRYLMEQNDKLDYQAFKDIKYDNYYHTPTYSSGLQNIEQIFHLDTLKYPDLTESIKLLSSWDRKTDPDRKVGVFSLTILSILEELFGKGQLPGENTLDEAILVKHLKKSQKKLKKHFKRIDVTLGEVQRLERGKKDYPVGGMPDVMAAMNFQKGKKGRLTAYLGDAFFMFVTWKDDGTVMMEAINAFGASANADSQHFDDQVDMYLKHQLREVYLDKENVMKEVEREYHPGE
ncbi:MAG: acyl-homoserine-lactone acylase [Maribacter sp.]|jgi:acyl-homoserine-lactone acylase